MYPGVHAASAPDRPAVVAAGSGRILTYGQLERRSSRLANALADAGLTEGDVVALLTDNDITSFEVYWAVMRSGMVLTPVNCHLSATEVAYIVNDSGARGLVVSAALAGLAEAVVTDTPAVVTRLAFGARPAGGGLAGYGDYEEALAAASPERPAAETRGSDMLYSSGTTGRPKGVRVPLLGQPLASYAVPLVELTRAVWGFGPDTVYLCPAPVYHAAPLRFGASVHALGGTVVMMERFDAEDALRAVERHRVTHSQWVPTMFVRMLKLPSDVRDGYDLSSHRVAMHAAAPCPPDVKRAMIGWWGPILAEYYSATESVGLASITCADWLTHPGSVGRPVLGTAHICDDEGDEVPVGADGTIYFARDEAVFAYHRDPEKTRAAYHPRHPTWATTGDLGHLDEEGFLYLTDRKAFMIISGGVNIYPREVEDVLTMHPAVGDVAVIGVPDPEMGEAVRAVVEPAPGVVAGRALERELVAYVRERIAHYKAPRGVDFVEALPRTQTGKLVKRTVRARYWPAAHG
jgi:fatty-acyl-CoA synthase